MKLLIADDDHTFVDSLVQMLQGVSLKITELYKCYNGEAAIEDIRTYRPDIVLCDIEMPGLDGVGVLKWLHEHKIQTVFIFLTCHDGFDNMRAAVQYGAFDYLKKPFLPQELTAVLDKALLSIRDKIFENYNEHALLYTELSHLQMQNLLDLLYNRSFPEDAAAVQQAIGLRHLNLEARQSVRLLLLKAEYWGMDHQVGLFSGLRDMAFKQLCAERRHPYLTVSEENSYSLLFFYEADNLNVEELQARCQRLEEQYRRQVRKELFCILSSAKELYHIPALRSEVEHALALAPKGGFYQADALRADGQKLKYGTEEMVRFLERGDKAGLIEYAAGCAQMAQRSGSEHVKAGMQALREAVVKAFTQYLSKSDWSIEDIAMSQTSLSVYHAAERSTFDMVKFISHIYDEIQNLTGSWERQHQIVPLVKKYVRENYAENITRETIAENLHISANYLSKLFSDQAGISLRDYLLQVRLKEAQRLLATTELPISQVAVNSGFNNFSNFSTIFKKKTGLSPNDYRKKNRG